MKKQNTSREYITTYQLKLPVDLKKMIEISDPVYTFCEVMDHIDLSEYLEEIQVRYAKLTMLDPEKLPRGRTEEFYFFMAVFSQKAHGSFWRATIRSHNALLLLSYSTLKRFSLN